MFRPLNVVAPCFVAVFINFTPTLRDHTRASLTSLSTRASMRRSCSALSQGDPLPRRPLFSIHPPPPPPSPYPLCRRMEESGHSVSPDQSMFLFLKLISRSALPPNVHISLNLFSFCHSAPSPLLSTTSPTPCKPRPFLNPGRCLPRPSRQQTKQQVPKGAMQMLPVLPLFKTLARSPLPAPAHTCPFTPHRG
jgi:hypothetical protein